MASKKNKEKLTQTFEETFNIYFKGTLDKEEELKIRHKYLFNSYLNDLDKLFSDCKYILRLWAKEYKEKLEKELGKKICEVFTKSDLATCLREGISRIVKIIDDSEYIDTVRRAVKEEPVITEFFKK